jgi:hypothetical protein
MSAINSPPILCSKSSAVRKTAERVLLAIDRNLPNRNE